MNKFFTLIELIVVIAVLGILAAIIIPNISSFQEEANETAIQSNIRNLQTSVDMYGLENYGAVPTPDIPLEDVPQPIDFNKIYPDYTRDLPETEGVNYWVDFQGKVWASTIDSPTDVTYNPGTLEWTGIENAAYYNIFKVIDNNATSSIKNKKTIFVKKLEDSSPTVQDTTLPNLNNGEQYLVSAVDNKGFESAPAGTNYTGYVEVELVSGSQSEQDNFVGFQPDPYSSYEQSFAYTGNYQEWIAPASGTYKLEVWGAAGARAESAYLNSSTDGREGGQGGYAYGEMEITQGTKLYVYVGGKGTSTINSSDSAAYNVGGWNGGGSSATIYYANGGGGATDIRTVNGVWDNTDGLNARIIVAGGGGGAAAQAIGGNGGGLTGQSGNRNKTTSYYIPTGGSQTSGGYTNQDNQSIGSFGKGGLSSNNGGWNGAGGGGGGYYGGAGGENAVSGAGGSSYVGNLLNNGTTIGTNTGHGKAKITRIQ